MKTEPERRPTGNSHPMPVVADGDIGRKPIQWGYATNDTRIPPSRGAQKIAAGANCQLAPLGRLALLSPRGRDGRASASEGKGVGLGEEEREG
jgi:hypothetical protein